MQSARHVRSSLTNVELEECIKQLYGEELSKRSEGYDRNTSQERLDSKVETIGHEEFKRCQTNKISQACKAEFDKYRDDMYSGGFCEPVDRSGGGKNHKNKRIGIEPDANEMNVNVEILFGQDNVDANLLLNPGEQRLSVSKGLYEEQLETPTRKQMCYVRMYGVGGQTIRYRCG